MAALANMLPPICLPCLLLNLLHLGVWPHHFSQTAHLRAPQHLTQLITPFFLESFFHLASRTSHSPGFPPISLSLSLTNLLTLHSGFPSSPWSLAPRDSLFLFLLFFFTQNYHYQTPTLYIYHHCLIPSPGMWEIFVSFSYWYIINI